MTIEARSSDEAPPDVDERYASSINTKSLAVISHRSGAVDVLAAAAWSESRIGAQLLRLHSEYDGGERPRSMQKTDVVLLRQRLKSLANAQEQIAIQAAKWGMESPEAKARAAVLWWLDRTCPACQGRRWRVIKGTPSLSNQMCPPRQDGGCGGSGEIPLPHGQDGKRLAGFIDDCLSRARSSIRARLRSVKG